MIDKQIQEALDYLGFTALTPIQEQAFEPILNGQSVAMYARTGSGKTAAYGIPLIQRIDWDVYAPQVLVLVPTRELGRQTERMLHDVGRMKRIHVESIYGQQSMDTHIRRLRTRTHVIVGTPGRLVDLYEAGNLNVASIQSVVIDEVDEMMDMGFQAHLDTLMDATKNAKQRIYISATHDESVDEFIAEFSGEVYEINDKKREMLPPNLSLTGFPVRDDRDVVNLLNQLHGARTLVFVNTRDRVYEIADQFDGDVYCLHGQKSQKQRERILDSFNADPNGMLISTNLVGRGIDLNPIAYIVNVDYPGNDDQLLHRIGRAARQKNRGHAFICTRHREDLDQFATYLNKPISLSSTIPEIETVLVEKVDTQEVMTIHIPGGRKDKVRPKDIVGGLLALEGLTMEDLGVIDVVDNDSFIEILHHKGPWLLKNAPTVKIKGKNRKLEQAHKK